MPRPPIEVADIFAAHANAFLKAYSGAVSSAKKKVLRNVVACRTAALGGHIERCDHCDFERVAYNSCRDRHCPKCQAAARAKWMEARAVDLLPVEYFHVVFTVPTKIAQIAVQNKKVMYGILMRASAETLQQIAADPKHLGARIGFLSLLHTWGQNLMHHPHVHCVVPGGGVSIDGTKWVSCRPGFFVPVRVLSKLFRGKFLDMTRRAFAQGRLSFQGQAAWLNDDDAFTAHLRLLYSTSWVVYAKKPFGGPEQVLKYLARYTHRVAISNSRIVSLLDDQVRFRWKDYACGNKKRIMKLDAVEFIRRFLLHVLPKGFVRIRHFGFLANTCRQKQLARCRELLACATSDTNDQQDAAPSNDAVTASDEPSNPCPACKKGQLIRTELSPGFLLLSMLARARSPPIGTP